MGKCVLLFGKGLFYRFEIVLWVVLLEKVEETAVVVTRYFSCLTFQDADGDVSSGSKVVSKVSDFEDLG